MAKEKEAAGAERAATGWKKKGILLGAALAGLLAGGTGAWYFLAGKGAGEADAKPVHVVGPKFFSLEPFVVNLAGDEQRYLQVGIDLRVADDGVTDKIKEHLPEIRNGVLLLLSSKTAAELATLDGKNVLREEIRAAASRPLALPRENQPEPAVPATAEQAPAQSEHGESTQTPPIPGVAATPSPSHGIVDVLLTSFVIQ